MPNTRALLLNRLLRIASIVAGVGLLQNCANPEASILAPEPAVQPDRSVAANAQPLLSSTIDNAAAVTSPSAGTGIGASTKTTPARDFVPGHQGNGIRINAIGEYVRFRELNGSIRNVELDQGTIDFWYQPTYPSTDGQAYRIFGIGPANGAGSIALHKRNLAGNNELYVQISSGAGVMLATAISPGQYAWVPGQWVNIRVTWDSRVAPGVQNTRIYVDGVEPPYAVSSLGPFPMRAESSSQYLYLGTIGATANFHASGVLDELAVYGSVLPPVPAGPDTLPPNVAISYPTNNVVVSNTIMVSALAGDEVGVVGVQFQLDGSDLGAEDLAPPFAVAWNTTLTADGPHSVTAIARDAAGNTTVSSAATATVNNTSRPNVVVLLMDDQRWDAVTHMPLLNQYLGAGSVQFANSFVSTSLCCPSRATLLTGQYAHNHHVETNVAPNGGIGRFNDATSLSVQLQQSGYRTGYAGKYFNDYHTRATYVPPGWNDWRVFNSAGAVYANYTMNENGATVMYGAGSQNYSTNAINGHAVQFINTAPGDQPFFLVYAPSAPHLPAVPDIPDQGAFSGFPNWRPPSYNEADVSDKPLWVRQLPLISVGAAANADANHRKQLESMLAVDRGIAAIMDAITMSGRLGNTVVIYTSDNGFSWGEHRLLDSKLCVYEECIRVPLWVQAPGVAGRIDPSLVQNIDLAPTIAELAGVPLATSPVNGRSLLPLLHNASTPWRSEVFHETFTQANFPQSGLMQHTAVRTDQFTYVEYANGERELYDLAADPHQLSNVHTDPAYQAVLPVLQALLASLRSQ